jgi:creatinine amidohydrolase
VSDRFIERVTWPEVGAAIEHGVDAVLIPIGTTEQHGPHMPLDTDCFIARSLSAAVVPRIIQVCKKMAGKE